MADVITILENLGVITFKCCEQLKKAVGFRNVAVHNYEAINWEIVDANCETFLKDFRSFSKEISQYAAL